MIKWMDETFYPNFKDYWDDDLYRVRLLEFINDETDVLDLGAGAGILNQMNFRGIARHICGIDLDPRVLENSFLDDAKVSDGKTIPYPDESFNLVFCDNVFEHLSDPLEVFNEVKRVLKPEGLFLFKTPSKFHYMPIISTVTPHWFHEKFGKILGREPDDTFPTHYRVNSRKSVKSFAAKAKFSVENIEHVEARPEYLRFTGFTYFLGMIYERAVNSIKIFSPMRILLIGILKKPG